MSRESSVEFYFRCLVLDTGDGVNDLEIFIYDFEPMDRRNYPTDWVKEHVGTVWDEEWVRYNCELPEEGSFQVIGKARLTSFYQFEEWDEETEILESRHVPVPEGWWEWRCGQGLPDPDEPRVGTQILAALQEATEGLENDPDWLEKHRVPPPPLDGYPMTEEGP